MSKGSKQRPKKVTDEEFERNWERIFKRRPDPERDPERADDAPRPTGEDTK